MLETEEIIATDLTCKHCGLDCNTENIRINDQIFCCEGCKMVYALINDTGLCNYYNLNDHPGINQREQVRENKFSFLDDEGVVAQLINFKDQSTTHISFYLPSIHCSSCLYLLENIHRFNSGIKSCEINFAKKEARLIFNHSEISLRSVAELLTRLGYEPYISLKDVKDAKPKTSKALIYRLGVAGFCFSNIMMMSFPEYLGLHESEKNILELFRYMNFVLAIPTFFYSASPFFSSAWSGLKNKFLNIDAPISLAILVTFSRSVYEIYTGTGGGYFDSMSGIIFFMLLGRVLQDKTYQNLEFDRDYTSYFPIAVICVQDGVEKPVQLSELKKGDVIRIHNEEIIPVDGILSKGNAFIDYSFVTGESKVNRIETGEIVYAGGKQKGPSFELLIIKNVTQSYLTQLWKQAKVKNAIQQDQKSFIHYLSKYFSYIVFSIASLAAAYWWFFDPTKILAASTAVLIVACPCALLLSNSFANGFILRILGFNKFFLKDAVSIEFIAGIKHIVFDKTGTLTDANKFAVVYEGLQLSEKEIQYIAGAVKQSKHPLSKAVYEYLNVKQFPTPLQFNELTGQGIECEYEEGNIKLGSEAFTGQINSNDQRSLVCVVINGVFTGRFFIENNYRNGMSSVISNLKKDFELSLLSGDNNHEAENLRTVFGKINGLHFNQKPEDKLSFIKNIQSKGASVMMVGDGLNDAGALMQSDVGIAIAENGNNFTPASDVILSAESFNKLPNLLALCSDGKKIIIASFIISLLYNVVGIYYSVTAQLSPIIAAVLMPASTFTIILFTYTSSWIMAKFRKLETITPEK